MVHEFTPEELEEMDLDELGFQFAEECYEVYLEARSTSDDFQLPPAAVAAAAAAATVRNTEQRLFNTVCPVCILDFAGNQQIAKNRCGHGICIDC